MKNWIGISLGDVTGIGPEVALKAVAAEVGADDFKYLLIGDEKILARLNEKLSLNLPLQKFSGSGDSGNFFVVNPVAESLPESLPAGSPLADHPRDTRERDHDPEECKSARTLAKHDKPRDRSRDRRERHDQEGETRPEAAHRLEEREVADHEAHHPARGEPGDAPAVEGRQRPTGRQKGDREKCKSGGEPQQVDAQRTDASRGLGEEEAGERPTGRGPEGGEFSSRHGSRRTPARRGYDGPP